MNLDTLNAGLELMVVGMGIVFLFLALLVVAVNLMSRLIQQYGPDEELKSVSASNVQSDASVIAAISAAVARYRSSSR